MDSGDETKETPAAREKGDAQNYGASGRFVRPSLCGVGFPQHTRESCPHLSGTRLFYFPPSPSLSCLLIPNAQSMDPDDYPLFRRISDNCVPNTTCTYFVGLVVNANDSDYLDFYLSGAATGWVAIGFSPSPSAVRVCAAACSPAVSLLHLQRGADVVGCSVESSGAVLAIDTYISVTLPNNNILDAEVGPRLA